MNLRINLLPPEVLERRRWEKWYQYIFFGFFALLILMLLVSAWLWLMAQTKADSLQSLQEQSANYKKEAEQYAVFEKKQNELTARDEVAKLALAGRVNMGRLADEISLVLPDEVWIEQLGVDQVQGLSVSGFTPLSSSQSASIGYKSVAKTLVRLDTLSDLSDVWLTAAASDLYASWQVESGEEPPTDGKSVVRFQISGKVVQDVPAAEPAAGAPATTE